MGLKAQMGRHCPDRIVGRISIHFPLLARFDLVLDPSRFDNPKWHSV
jgi:hypothetical protein